MLEDNHRFYQSLRPYTSFYIDQKKNGSIEDIIDKSTKFKPVATPYINLGAVEKGRLWLRTGVSNASEQSGVWRLDINRQYYQELSIYIMRSDANTRPVLQHSKNDKYTDREIDDRMLGIDLEMAPGESVNIYISLTSNTSTFMPLAIGTIAATMNRHADEDSINWLFNGALIAVILITLTMISVVSWQIAISFSIYILSGLIYVIHTDGYFFAHFWPENMAWNDPLNLSFMLAMPIFGLVFARNLFNFRANAPVLDFYLKFYIALAFLAAIFSFPIFEIRILKVCAYLLTPVGSVMQLLVATLAVKKGLLGAKPYFIGALIIMASLGYAILGHAMPGYFNLDRTLDFGHFALVSESIAFAAAIAVRLLGLRDERDHALQAELKSTQERLDISQKLQKVEKDFTRAQRLADARRTQLSTVSHDIQQPLSSLRLALDNIGGADEEASDQMHKAFDYLEGLASQQLAASRGDVIGQQQDSRLEIFEVSAVLDNVFEMFYAEAKSKGSELRYRACNLSVISEPVSLMRAVSNLVSNAIEHNTQCNILIAARRRGDRLRIEVWDDGEGVLQGEFENHLAAYSKGEGSCGHGLGLSIVSGFAKEYDLELSLKSILGLGTRVMVYLPISE